MTRLISIKTTSELPEVFKDKIEFQVVDNKVEAVVVKLQGSYIRVTSNSMYSNDLKILTEQPKKEVTKYELSGTVGGMIMQPEMFDSEHEADEKLRVYKSKFNYDGVDLRIEPVVEFVDEDKI